MRKLLDGGVGSAEDQDEVSTWCVYVSVSDVLAVLYTVSCVGCVPYRALVCVCTCVCVHVVVMFV